MKEGKLKELQGTSRLALGFFNSIIRRIECTKPLAGRYIEINQQDDGIVISLNTAVTLNNVVTLNVCSNGVPDTLLVYSPVTAVSANSTSGG